MDGEVFDRVSHEEGLEGKKDKSENIRAKGEKSLWVG
jgi:hypothetical protein